jgi:predicted enzyme related to lactoylglutathione lyase
MRLSRRYDVKAHPIVHIEIPASDLKQTSQFYAEVFGWQVDPSTENYPVFSAEGGPGGGFVPLTEETTAGPVGFGVGKPLLHLATDDIEATLATVEAHGGKTLREKTEIPSIGWWAVFADPTGNPIGIFCALPGEAAHQPAEESATEA